VLPHSCLATEQFEIRTTVALSAPGELRKQTSLALARHHTASEVVAEHLLARLYGWQRH